MAVSFAGMPFPVILILLVAGISGVLSLYEDQVNKWDWRRSLVGPVDQVIGNHLSPQSDLIVSTASAVIASLSLRNGSILYRHVLEEGSVIDLIDREGDHMFGLKEGIVPTSLVSVSGHGKYVRQWDGRGALTWEKSLPDLPAEDMNAPVFAVDQEKKVIAAAGVGDKGVTLILFSLISMQEKERHVYLMENTTSIRSLMFAANPFTLLAVDTSLPSIRLMSTASADVVKTVPLKDMGLQSSDEKDQVRLKLLSQQKDKSIVSLVLGSDANILLRVQGGELTLLKILPNSVAVSVVPVDAEGKYAAFVMISKPESMRQKESENRDYRIACFDMETWKEMGSLNQQLSVESPARVTSFHVLPFLKVGSMIQSYQVFVTLADGSMTLISPFGGPAWTREESLADVITSEFVDYPLSELDASIEQAFLTSPNNIAIQFVNRIKSQVQQMQALVRGTLVQVKHLITSPSHSLTESMDEPVEPGSLTRDYFGLRKLIVILTQTGKIVSIDTLTGQIIWTLYDEELGAEIAKQQVKDSVSFVVQRTSSYYPFPAVACIVTQSGFIFDFDPVKGQVMRKERIGEPVKQMMHLPFTDNQHVKGVLLLTASHKVVLHPHTIWSQFSKQRSQLFIMTADPATGQLQGFSFRSVSHTHPVARVVWSAVIPVDPSAGMHVVFKRVHEQVHSLGRVLGDRNVLYKYLNPNLAAIATIRSEATTSPDGQQTTSGLVDLYLVDAVTGRIVYSSAHKKARGPVHMVHSENTVIYSYYNEKSRRTEISAVDLYEGLSQANGSSFCSMDQGTSGKPVIEHNSFIFPTGIRVMTDTVTEKGLTNKHLLIAIASGGLLELPKAFLDPRRPLIPTPEHREEGLIPYMPELPIPSEGFLNYNKSLMRVKSIQTAGSGLESTCLLLAHGLDLFHSRVTPSKTFDILKDDFDFVLISAVLFLLIAVAYASKWAAAHKSLKSAWT